MAAIGSILEAVLGLDNSGFVRGIRGSVAEANKAAKGMESAFSGIEKKLLGVFSVAAVAGAARSIGAFASEIHDLSDTTNLSTDQFQQFSFAVSQSGGSQEAFVKAMVSLIQSMEQAKNGVGSAADSFGKLKINLDDIDSSSPAKIWLMMADAMKESGGSGEAFAALADLIGIKVATKMVPSLKLGSAGFKELAESAKIASKPAIDNIEAAQDSVDKWVRSLKALSVELVASADEWFGGTGAEERLKREDDYLTHMAQKAGELSSNGITLVPGAEPITTEATGPSTHTHISESTQDLQSALERGHREAADMLRDAEEEAKLIAEQWQRQADAQAEIDKVIQETADVEKEAARDAMTNQQLAADLMKERVELLRQAEQYEADIFQLHEKDAAQARLQAAEISRRINRIDFGPTPGPSPNRDIADAERLRFGQLGNFQSFSPSSIRAGGLSSAGLTSGGLGGQGYNVMRRGSSSAAAGKPSDDTIKLIQAINRPAWVTHH